MLAFHSSARIYLCVQPCDMRKSFNGLYAIARDHLASDPLQSRAAYIFCNRKSTRIKILYFDGSGLWIFAKRLEKGTFSWPRCGDEIKITLKPVALNMLLEGIDMRQGCQRAWYEL